MFGTFIGSCTAEELDLGIDFDDQSPCATSLRESIDDEGGNAFRKIEGSITMVSAGIAEVSTEYFPTGDE